MTTVPPRRHCMVVHSLYPIGETRVQREAAALIDRGFEVDVLCPRGPGEGAHDVHDGVRVFRLPVPRFERHTMALQLVEYLAFFLMAAWRLTFLHRKHRYRTVQVHNLPDFLVFAAAIPKLMGARVILDLHDLMPELFAARSNKGMGSFAARALLLQERLACSFADHVITVTARWRGTLIDRGVPPDKVSVVMNLADTQVFRRAAGDNPSPRAPGLRVLYHGTFTHRYGVDLLIRATAKASTEMADLQLRVLGDGETRSGLVQLVHDLGVGSVVEISDGMVAAEELPAAIEWADIGVVPNRRNIFTDGILPTKLLEFVAMDTPVVVARTDAIVEYFSDDMVEYFEPGDVDALATAIIRLGADPTRRAALAQNAGRFNASHSWTNSAAAYAENVTRLGEGNPHGFPRRSETL